MGVLKKVMGIYNIIKSILPSSYKIPKLAFFEDEESMVSNSELKKLKDEAIIYAIINPNTLTISLPLKMLIEVANKDGDIENKEVSIHKVDDELIASILLHEIGHIYAGERYGYDSKQYDDEKYCDRFAQRWVKKLKEKKLIT